jgi:hypothetical protein
LESFSFACFKPPDLGGLKHKTITKYQMNHKVNSLQIKKSKTFMVDLSLPHFQ